jgi:hypothetical protein
MVRYKLRYMLEQLLNDSIVHNSSLLYNRFIEKINRINIINQQVTKKKKIYKKYKI